MRRCGTARRTFAVGGVLLALGLAACGGGGDKERAGSGAGDEGGGNHKTFAGGAPGGSLVVLTEGEPDDLNPLTFDSNPAFQVVHLLFRALARRDSTLTSYTPDLLQGWEQPDSATVVMKVRPGLRWHDGRPVTANDVVFTVQRQQDSTTASPRQADVAGVESIRATDSMTVEVKLNRTGPSTLNALLEVIPVPKHLLDTVPGGRMRFSPFGQNPVGNGLYRFGQWQKGQQVTLMANAEAPEGRPSLDRIVIRVVPDATTRMTELMNGNADMAVKISAEQAKQVENGRGVKLYTAAQVRPAWIAWNTSREPVNDPAVRRAILMGIDRAAIVRAQFGANGTPAMSPIPPKLSPGGPTRPIPFDANGARQLLAQAGWADTNRDGILEKNGKPLRVEVEFSSSDAVRRDMLIFMQQQLKQIGVDLAPREYERTSWVERLRARNFQGSFWGWGWGPGVMGPNAEMVFHSRSIPPNGPNFAGYSNPRTDAMIDSILVDNDAARARGTWQRLEQQLIDDAVYAPIFLDPEFYAVHQRYANVKFRGPEWWEDVIFWHVPADRRIPRDRART